MHDLYYYYIPAIAVRYLTSNLEDMLWIGCWTALMAAPLSYALHKLYMVRHACARVANVEGIGESPNMHGF